MSAFSPVDEANPSLADIARGINAVHTCVDEFRTEQARVNYDAAKVRDKVANTLDTLAEQVGSLDTRQDVSDGKITKLAQMFGAEKVEPGEKRPHGSTILTWPGWKQFAAAGGCIGIFVFVYQLGFAIAPVIHKFLMGLSPT